MTPLPLKPRQKYAFWQACACVMLISSCVTALAAEGARTRQAPIGMFGGEISAPADTAGFFGTAGLTTSEVYRVADGNGNDIGLPAQAKPLPAPLAGYTLNLPQGTINLHQSQSVLNLVAGYLTDSAYGNGHFAMVVNLPLVTQRRTLSAILPQGRLVNPQGRTLPATAAPSVAANAAAQAQVAGVVQANNAETTGLGDAELSLLWIRHQDRLKIAAGAAFFIPTGQYDKNRGPNPGLGNFYTLRPGVAVTYARDPSRPGTDWDAGVTLAARLSYGINTENRDTRYRSGNFVYTELAATKEFNASYRIGMNIYTIQQVSDDSGAAAPAGGNRLKTFGYGPFISYKAPGQDLAFNLHYSDSFGGRNALVVRSLQFRMIKGW